MKNVELQVPSSRHTSGPEAIAHVSRSNGGEHTTILCKNNPENVQKISNMFLGHDIKLQKPPEQNGIKTSYC